MKPHVFLVLCPSCKRRHRMTHRPCPECQGRGGYIAYPISDTVSNKCHYTGYRCDGCDAYRDHLR